MIKADLISCIVPTYNRAYLLKDAIESTINQTYSYWEMIIVDDGSVDGTDKVVNDYLKKDPRIRFYKNPNKGGSAARNFGISKARGEFIAFLDDDDISLPHRFNSQLSAAKKSGSNYIVSGYQVRKRNTEKLLTEVKLELKGSGAGFPSRWLIGKSLLEKVGGFDENFTSMQDIELSYRLAEHEVFVLHDDVVSVLYTTDNSVSKRLHNSIKGKELLMERLAHKMHPIEAADWYYTIAQGHYLTGNLERAGKYFKVALDNNKRINFRIAYIYFILIKHFFKINILNKNSGKFFSLLGKYRFPVLVNHPIIT